MTLKEASRRAVAELRKWENAAPESEAEVEAQFEMRMAVRELERLTDDDHPEPVDLAAMAESILSPGITCPRWHSAPVEPCAAFRGHRGPCIREKDLVKGDTHGA